MTSENVAFCKCGRAFLKSRLYIVSGETQMIESSACGWCMFESTTDRAGTFAFIPVGIWELKCGCVWKKEEDFKPCIERWNEACKAQFYSLCDELKEPWVAEHIREGVSWGAVL